MYSIIIPARNECLNLWYTLHGLAIDPDDEEREILVVDSNSEDGTERFLLDPNIKSWVRRIPTSRTGPGPVRQAGALCADYRSDVFIFVDAHCLLSPSLPWHAVQFLRAKPDVGSLHFPIGSSGVKSEDFSTHYHLTLEKNFWGDNWAGRFDSLTEIAAAGHGCVAVRRDNFSRVGGYCSELADYGGDETYLDLKFARCGFRNYSMPWVYCLHCSQRQMDYPWSYDTLFRNNVMAAYSIGGKAWAENVRNHHLELPGWAFDKVQQLYDTAIKAAEFDRAHTEAVATRSLEEVLADFRERGVPC